MFTAGILAFGNVWDELLLALSFNASASMRTLPVGIRLYRGEFSLPWPIISAALIVAVVAVVATAVPIAVLFAMLFAVLIAPFLVRVVGGLTPDWHT